MDQNHTAPHTDTAGVTSHTVAARHYLAPLDGPSRGDLLAALQSATDATLAEPACTACSALVCRDEQHQPRLEQVRAWRNLTADLARLPATGPSDEPVIRRPGCPVRCARGGNRLAARRHGLSRGRDRPRQAAATPPRPTCAITPSACWHRDTPTRDPGRRARARRRRAVRRLARHRRRVDPAIRGGTGHLPDATDQPNR